jgi:shikimate dehydrogenase
VKAPSTTTRLVVLLGDPVEHSLSPSFQNAAIEAAGLDAVYVALRCVSADVPGLIQGIARGGGAGNVTIPHKQVAAATVEEPSEAVLRTGACNTFWLEDGRIRGDNTDVAGFVRASRALRPEGFAGARVLLIGAGGSARAVVAGLVDEAVGQIAILNRTEDRAAALRDRFQGAAPSVSVVTDVEGLRGEHFDLVVNSSALGLHPSDPPPLPADLTIDIGAALDLVYTPGQTAWIRSLQTRGVPAADGIEMLLQQGAAAFERWWGRPAPLAAMRAALPSHL